MVDKVDGGNGGLNSQTKHHLEADYKAAAEKFQAALDKYSDLDNPGQKKECKKVMNEYMNVMNHIAADLHKQVDSLSTQNSKIQADLNALDTSDAAAGKLKKDLDKAEKIV
jgi:DNA repair ATPase RecN